MSEKLTLEDWNTISFLTKNLYLPIEFDIEEGEHDLYDFIISSPNSEVHLKFCVNNNWHFIDNNSGEEINVFGNTLVKINNNYFRAFIRNPTNFKFKGNLDIIEDWNITAYSKKTITPLTKMFGYYFKDEFPNFYFEKNNYDLNYIKAVGTSQQRYPIYYDDNGSYVDGSILTADKIESNSEYVYYIYPNMKLAYEPPIISVNEPLYIGNNNILDDKITIIDDVEYVVYYHNKAVTEIKIDEDFELSEITVKVVTKSHYPYLPSEQSITIPVVYKEYEQLSDFENYDFIKLEERIEVGNTEIILNKDITIYSETGLGEIQSHNDGGIIISDDANLILKNIHLNWINIFNKGNLTVKDGGFGSIGYDMVIVNDGTFITEDDCVFSQEITIFNNGNIIIKNSKIFMQTLKSTDLPFIHNTGTYEIINNRIIFDGQYDGFNVAFIRTNNIDVMQMQKDNNFNYNGTLTLDDKTYLVKGNGFAYALIDDDTIRFNNLEVDEE